MQLGIGLVLFSQIVIPLAVKIYGYYFIQGLDDTLDIAQIQYQGQLLEQKLHLIGTPFNYVVFFGALALFGSYAINQLPPAERPGSDMYYNIFYGITGIFFLMYLLSIGQYRRLRVAEPQNSQTRVVPKIITAKCLTFYQQACPSCCYSCSRCGQINQRRG